MALKMTDKENHKIRTTPPQLTQPKILKKYDELRWIVLIFLYLSEQETLVA